MRARRREDALSTDSLLDTMANVVGILIVVMAVIQLSVSDAVQRIRTSSDRAVREELLHDLDGLRERSAMLEARQALLRRNRDDVAEEIAVLREQLTQLDTHPLSRSALQRDESVVQTGLAERRARLRELEEQISKDSSSLADLRIRLADQPVRAEPQDWTVRLPDPRPAPPGTDRLAFFCRYGRVVPTEYAQLEGRLVETVRSVLSAGPGRVLIGQSDVSVLVDHFQLHDIGTSEFRWRLFDLGRLGLIARLGWRNSSLGETAEDLQSRESRFLQTIYEHRPDRRYVQFHVWSDSFEVYLEARRIAETAGFAAGWLAYDQKEEFEGNLLAGAVASYPIPVD